MTCGEETMKDRAQKRVKFLVKQFDMMAQQAAEQRMQMQEGPEPMSDEQYEKLLEKAREKAEKKELN